MTSIADKIAKINNRESGIRAKEHESNNLKRARYASEKLRALESAWWSSYAKLEDLYFWRLPDHCQPLARLRYIKTIAEYFKGSKTIVDYGCGSGWLSRMLKKHTAAEIIGVDFSIDQIELAKKTVSSGDFISFQKIDGPSELPAADAYLFHGLLHHLPSAEIDEILISLKSKAAPNTKIVMVEPTCFPGNTPDAKDTILLDQIQSIVQTPSRLLKNKGITECQNIQDIREKSIERWWGTLPYGPSPLEKPFEHNELSLYLKNDFNLIRDELVQFLPASQALSGELAMTSETDFELISDASHDLLSKMDILESIILQYPRPPDAGWYMNLLFLETTRS